MSNKNSKNKQMIDNRFINRRQFLMGAGSSFLLLPPLLSLMPSSVAAQVMATPRRRSVAWYSLNGLDAHQLYPANQADMVKQTGLSVYSKNLSSYSGQISRLIDADFVSMYPHMNLIQGLSLTSGAYAGHNCGLLAGLHSDDRTPSYGMTIDGIMERSSNVYKSGEVVANKAIRLFTSEHDRAMTYYIEGGSMKMPSGIQGDLNLFNTLFKNFTPTGSTAGPTDDKLIVDKVYADLKALESNTRISKADKIVLDRYVSSVYELQLKVNAANSSGPACVKPSLTIQASKAGNYWWLPDDGWGIKDNGAMYDNYVQLIKLAFACDLTRVVTVGCTLWTDSPVNRDSNGGIHHEAGSSEIAADRQKWHLKKFLNLAKELSATPDPYNSGSLLDNSFMLWTNELGDWTTGHSTLCMPAVTFGSLGGTFKTGYHVDYRQRPYSNLYIGDLGRPYKQLLQSMMLGMGVTKTEYSQYGDGKGFGNFVNGINQFGHVHPNAFTPYAAEHNDGLPFLFNGA